MRRRLLRALVVLVVLVLAAWGWASVDRCGAWEATPPALVGIGRATGPLRVGAAVVAIAPSYPVTLAGYGPPRPLVEAASQPVNARATVVEVGGQRIALVVVDTLLVTSTLRASLQQATGVTTWLAASHTHSSLGGIDRRLASEVAALGSYDAAQEAAVLTAAKDAVAQATARLAPAHLDVVTAEAPGLNVARSGSEVERALTRVRFTGEHGPIAQWIVFSAHPTLVPRRAGALDPDWPGHLAASQERDGGPVTLVLQGGGGNASVDRTKAATPAAFAALVTERLAALAPQGAATRPAGATTHDGADDSTTPGVDEHDATNEDSGDATSPSVHERATTEDSGDATSPSVHERATTRGDAGDPGDELTPGVDEHGAANEDSGDATSPSVHERATTQDSGDATSPSVHERTATTHDGAGDSPTPGVHEHGAANEDSGDATSPSVHERTATTRGDAGDSPTPGVHEHGATTHDGADESTTPGVHEHGAANEDSGDATSPSVHERATTQDSGDATSPSVHERTATTRGDAGDSPTRDDATSASRALPLSPTLSPGGEGGGRSIELAWAEVAFELPRPDATRLAPAPLRAAAENALCEDAEHQVSVSALRLGPATFLFVPVEPSAAAARVLSEQAGAARVLSNANGYVGYVEPDGVARVSGGESKKQYFDAGLLERLADAARLAGQAVAPAR